MADEKEPVHTEPMKTVGLSWINVNEYAEDVLGFIKDNGETSLDFVRTTIKLIKAVSGKDYPAITACLNQEKVDITALITAFETEFGL
jgi:hypothetical protein